MQVFERWLQPHIVLLDVGMATELRSQDRYNMLHLFKSFIEHDGRTMAAHVLAFAGKKQACIDREGFSQAVAKCVPCILDFGALYSGFWCLVRCWIRNTAQFQTLFSEY
jgi:predicted unusual protein kinase regulating ubiquinone biosynthesis (AarF/ABC1/UbiB family)